MNPLQSQAFALKQAGLARARANTLPSSGSFVNGSGAMAALGQIGSLVSLLNQDSSSSDDSLLSGDTQSIASASLARDKRKQQANTEKLIRTVMTVFSTFAMLL